ncbi:MAG: ABC transporter substrate-binding protein [Reyranella sp.]|nr:ABC transporter substrate-binding protein [Reyranella sp.]MBL6652364.1 ABC transporter substrate-binding protein [Reyranella sp.]
MISRRAFATAAAILPAALLPPARAGAADILRVGDQKGGYKSLMEASGALDGFESKIEWVTFSAAAPLLEAMNAGAIDSGGVGDAPFAFARAAGLRAKVVAATRSSGAATALLVPAASAYASFGDLRGKRIGTGKGSVGHFLVVAARERANLTRADVSLAFLAPGDAKMAFARGSIDAWATWSQYVWQAVLQDDARVLVDGQGLMSGLSYHVATERAIAAKRDLLWQFCRRLEAALRWSLANIDAYAAAWARETGVPYEVSQKTLLVRALAPVSIDDAVITAQQQTIDLYVREGVLPASYPAEPAFDRSFNV